ncbi:hypothetical protein [Shouchella shacheensis]|uniref:hypothetical protein n=1 Tax=Shouchella shacheensis TaxID=1649580 RepID=UPI00073FBFD3|nr:hypothetical protein [Shouchella shacheensis]
MIERDNETEEFIKSLPQAEIYFFMEGEYNRLTHFGENYDADIHDQQVAERAAKEFDLTEDEAGQLYADFGMRIAEFWEEREHRNSLS